MQPLVQIVNEYDVVIGHKKREDIDPENNIYRVTALWVTNLQGQILLAQRAFTKSNNPGKWGAAVAGTVEDDETYEENVYKEAEEEIGLTDTVFKLGPKVRIISPRNYFVQIFFAIIDSSSVELKIQDDEVHTIAWIDNETLMNDLKTNPEKYTNNFYKLFKLIT